MAREGWGNDNCRRIPDQLPPRRWSSGRYRHRRRKDRDCRRRRVAGIVEQRTGARYRRRSGIAGAGRGHMHLDKTLTGLPWMGHAAGPTRMSRIETDKTILPHLPLSTEERAGNLIRECVARGTCHLRTHVDIDVESGLAKLDGVLAARERHRHLASVQIVAFPQSGVMRCPGILDLLDPAVREGADLVGGI